MQESAPLFAVDAQLYAVFALFAVAIFGGMVLTILSTFKSRKPF